MILYLINLSGNLMEWFINVSFFSALHPRRFSKKTSVLLGGLFTLLQFMNTNLFLRKSSLIVAFSILYGLLLSLLYRSKWYWKILESLFLYVVLAAPEYLLVMLMQFVLKVDFAYTQQNMVLYAVCTWTSKFLSYLIVKLPRVRKLHKSSFVPRAVLWPMLCIPAATVTISFTLVQGLYISQDRFFIILSTLSMILLLLMNVVTFWIIEHQNEFVQTKAALRYAETHIRNQVGHYKELYDYQTEIRKSRHDEKNKLLALSGLLQAGETEQAKALVEKELARAESTAKAVMDSGNPVIDAVLQSKREAAKSQNITLTARVQITEQIAIDALELGVLIGNAVDNAIEAAGKVQSVPQPEIVVTIRSLQGRIWIGVENPTVEESGNAEALQSAKPNPKNHGFGLQSIRSIAEKYDGTVRITWESHRFSIGIGLSNLAKT